MKFEVWSPLTNQVDLITARGPQPMTKDDRGWWSIETEAQPGTKYQFRVDGQGAYPDPRSAWQPEGVHGPSVVIDHSAFRWTDNGFVAKPLSQAVIYELHIGTFTPEGTYEAAAKRLGFLRDLGITHVELMPLATFPGERGWGYDGAAIYAPHPAYGTTVDLKSFIQQAHDLGLAVLLDVVYNHLGPDGNYLGAFGPYFTDRVKTPWGDAINFDGEHSDPVREFFIDNALMWMRDYHFDGLRLDAVHAIFDQSALHVLEQMAERVADLSALTGRPLALIAESDFNTPRLVQSHLHGGFALSAHWEDDFHHALHSFLTGERAGYHVDFGSLAQLAKSLEQAYVFDGQYSTFRKRSHGRPPLHVNPSQIIVFAQNHDQTGNRALGERMSQLLEPAVLKATAALVLLSPFVPMLFQGEEWGAATPFLYFTDHHEELGKLVTEGRRKEFSAWDWSGHDVPDPQSPETFRRSKLRWSELDEECHQDILEWHRSLIALRRSIPDGTPAEIAFDESARWLTLRRGTLLAVFNFSEEAQTIPIPPGNWEPNFLAGASLPAHSTTLLTARP
ncbi:MAG TPA: malto-oligosyltrehalose trehalohydrolase [Chthoniobacterales bacterium]|nr:malto-oligosyltrehalose trehalohydrolase [Chthoniobacterales bacterium]